MVEEHYDILQDHLLILWELSIYLLIKNNIFFPFQIKYFFNIKKSITDMYLPPAF